MRRAIEFLACSRDTTMHYCTCPSVSLKIVLSLKPDEGEYVFSFGEIFFKGMAPRVKVSRIKGAMLRCSNALDHPEEL